MENRGWWIAGVVLALCLALGVGAVFGGGLVYTAGQLGDVVPVAMAQGPEADLGIVIGSVVQDGPAAEAGVVRGDILLEIDGQPVDCVVELMSAVQELEPGDSAELTVLHGDHVRTLDATVGEENGKPHLGLLPCGCGAMSVSVEEFQAGARIVEVVPDSPAELAGLEVGDTIVSVDGREPGVEQSLAEIIAGYEPGDSVELVVEGPAGERRDVEIELGQNPEDKARAYLGVRYSALPGDVMRWGEGLPLEKFHLEDLPFDLPEGEGLPFGELHEFDLDDLPFDLPHGESMQGAVVHEVVEDSPAADAGLEQDDIITAIDGETVEGPQSLAETVAGRQPGDTVTLTVLSPGSEEEKEVAITLTEHPDDSDKTYLGVVVGGYYRTHRFGDGEQPGDSEFFKAPFGFELPFDELPFEFPLEELPFDLDELMPQPDGGDQSA